MIVEQQIVNKVNELESYCANNGEPGGDYAGFVSTLRQAITTYYDSSSSNLCDNVQTLIAALYNDLSRRCTTYEKQIGDPLPTNHPKGYEDLTEIFDGNGVFSEILNMDNEKFLNGFPVNTSVDEMTGASSTSVEINPIITTWISTLNVAHEAEIAQLEALIKYCTDGATQTMLIALFEDRGKATRTKEVSDIAKEIYIDKKIQEVIQAYNLKIHVPTYLRSDSK